MSKVPKISVIVPCHNYGRYLGQCLTSIFNQTLPPDEVIVVDDASEDNTPEVVKNFSKKFPNLKYYRVDFHNGNKTRNFGFKKSSGNYLVFFDADNYMRKEFLEKLYEVLEGDPAAAFAYCDRYNVPEGDVSWYPPPVGLWRSKDFDPHLLKLNNYIDLASLVRRSAFPGFDEKLKRLQDWDFWLNLVLLKGGRGLYLPEPLFFYRVHKRGITAREDLAVAKSYIRQKYGRELFPYNQPYYWRLKDVFLKIGYITGTDALLRRVKRFLFDRNRRG